MLPEHFRNFFPEKSHSSASTSLPFLTELSHFSSGFVETCNSTFEVDGQVDDDESSIGSPPHPKVEARTALLSDVTPVMTPTACSTSRDAKAQSCKRPSSENFNFQSLKRAAPESSPSESSDFKEVLSPASSIPTEDCFTDETSRRVPVNKLDYQSASAVTPTRAHARSRHRSQQTSESSLSAHPLVVSAPAQSSTSASPQSFVASMGRRWRRGLLSALATVCSHRHAHIFQHAVTDDIAPGYSGMVRQPIDLTSLRRRVEASLACLAGTTAAGPAESAPLSPAAGEAVIINTAKRLLRDLLLMFVNARMYNNREHSVHRMAGEMFADVFSELRPLWSVLAEDISGFPPLPGSPLPVPSTLRRRTISSAGGVIGLSSSGPHSPQQPSTPSTVSGPSSEKAA
uniref:Bromo domain-containing protein n=3 Tax=Schistocephalus solidus TaxID=70667 RepID=A0A0X3NX70_SCHSO